MPIKGSTAPLGLMGQLLRWLGCNPEILYRVTAELEAPGILQDWSSTSSLNQSLWGRSPSSLGMNLYFLPGAPNETVEFPT